MKRLYEVHLSRVAYAWAEDGKEAARLAVNEVRDCIVDLEEAYYPVDLLDRSWRVQKEWWDNYPLGMYDDPHGEYGDPCEGRTIRQIIREAREREEINRKQLDWVLQGEKNAGDAKDMA